MIRRGLSFSNTDYVTQIIKVKLGRWNFGKLTNSGQFASWFESNNNDSKHLSLHYFENLYSIFNPNKKGKETNTQFKVSKQNFILDLINTYKILWKAVLDENRIYGLEGDLSYLSRSSTLHASKSKTFFFIKSTRLTRE